MLTSCYTIIRIWGHILRVIKRKTNNTTSSIQNSMLFKIFLYNTTSSIQNSMLFKIFLYNTASSIQNSMLFKIFLYDTTSSIQNSMLFKIFLYNTASSIQNSMLFKIFLYFIWERLYCNSCDYFFYLWLLLFEVTKYPVKYWNIFHYEWFKIRISNRAISY